MPEPNVQYSDDYMPAGSNINQPPCAVPPTDPTAGNHGPSHTYTGTGPTVVLGKSPAPPELGPNVPMPWGG